MNTAGRVDAQRHTETTPDVLCPPDYAVRELSARGRLSKLDHSKIPNLVHIDDRFREGRAHDPESRFSVVKDWGTTGFMYRTDIVDGYPNSWADFWKLACSAKFSGQVTVLDSPGEVIGAALKMRGNSYNAVDSEALAQARDDLIGLKQNLFAFETNYKPLFLSGEICLALGWNGDAAALKAQGMPIRYVVPAEGSQIWEDDWAIAADAPDLELAHAFLNFVQRPEVAAQEARYTRYATGNDSALELLEDELRLDDSTYPPRELLDMLESGMPLSIEGNNRREEVWKEIRG
jgi:spermidine/putrescine-binding protein